MENRRLEIIVSTEAIHPDLGKRWLTEKRFRMEQATEAENYYWQLEQKRHGSTYEVNSIYITIVIE